MNRNVWGHRGCRGVGNPPENSLAAFRSAIEAGVGGIELDIHLSKDGLPVVFHDATLERMTGVAGEISSYTLLELKKLLLLNPHGGASKEPIPTLDQVLELVDRRRQVPPFVVNIELKDARSVQAVAAIAQQRVANGWSLENFLVSSFEMGCLRQMKTLLPTVPIGVLFDCPTKDLVEEIKETADLKPCTINIPFPALTDDALNLIGAAGSGAVAWTSDEVNPYHLSQGQREQYLKRLREREFVVITDFPKELLELLLLGS